MPKKAKKGKARAAPAATAAAAAKAAAEAAADDANASNGFATLPLDVHRAIQGDLALAERMDVAATARGLLLLYGQDDTVVKRSLRRGWGEEKGSKSDAAAMGFVRRLPNLKQLEVRNNDLLPYAAAALGTGHYRQLSHVTVSSDHKVGGTLAAAQSLAGALDGGALSALQELAMKGDWEPGSFAAVIKALARGAAPGLRALHLTGHSTFEEAWKGERLHGEALKKVRMDRASTKANLLLLAEALSARRALGTCVALAKLDGWDWSWKGDMSARKRLWVALLPGVEWLPQDLYSHHDNLWEIEFARALRSVGAPHLLKLHLVPWKRSDAARAHVLPALEAVPSMARLEQLTIGVTALSAPVLQRLGQLTAAASPRPLFPALQEIVFQDSTFGGRKEGPAEFVAVGGGEGSILFF
jgi:hypothetical protein